ncbi:MAG: hypothetical protein HYY18_18090 [Planctomycetes bacterium]|nr:hypothetical protein [Planctomycetota bacterium]
MNPRILVAFALSEAVILALAAWLYIQNQSLRQELAARPAAAAPATGASEGAPAVADAGKRVAELEKALADREAGARAEKVKLEKEIESVKRELAAAKAEGKPAADEGIKSLEDVLAKHKRALIYGRDIPEAVAKDLGLEPAQVVALKMAMEDELRRLDESMSRFYAGNMEGATAEQANKPAKDLIMAMMGPIAADMKEFSEMPLAEQLKIHTTTSIEEVLGPDRFLSKLSHEVHSVRLKTYVELERSLTPEQIAKLRSEYLREGMLAYDDQFKLEFGAAPKETK